jgi:hypothetical protein
MSRHDKDNYPTPAWCVHRLLESNALPVGGTWCEPCVGDGHIVAAVSDYLIKPPTWKGYELRSPGQKLHGFQYNQDFLSLDEEHVDPAVAVVLTNPPFSLAPEFIVQSLLLYHEALLAFLLPLSFLATEKRAPFMHTYAPDVYVLPDRPSFTANNKTDSAEYGWFIWHGQRLRKSGSVQVLQLTPKEIRKPTRRGSNLTAASK